MRRQALVFGAALLLSGCETGANRLLLPTPAPESLRLEIPDRSYSLAPGDRERIRESFDADALERLLRAVRPEYRSVILSRFQWDASGRSQGDLVELPDPHLQALLADVWAPYWEQFPAEAYSEEDAPIPGRPITAPPSRSVDPE